MSIQSPFHEDLPQCKSTLRKLRKKIYKYSTTHQMHPKPKDSIHTILERLRTRKLPEFLIDSLKKRRNFDINNIKSVMITEGVQLNKIVSMRDQQEQQVELLFKDHKERMAILNEKKQQNLSNALKFNHQLLKINKKQTTYSSTQEEQESSSLEENHFNDVEDYHNSHPHNIFNERQYFDDESHNLIHDSQMKDQHYGHHMQSLHHLHDDESDNIMNHHLNKISHSATNYQNSSQRRQGEYDLWSKFELVEHPVDDMINCD